MPLKRNVHVYVNARQRRLAAANPSVPSTRTASSNVRILRWHWTLIGQSCSSKRNAFRYWPSSVAGHSSSTASGTVAAATTWRSVSESIMQMSCVGGGAPIGRRRLLIGSWPMNGQSEPRTAKCFAKTKTTSAVVELREATCSRRTFSRSFPSSFSSLTLDGEKNVLHLVFAHDIVGDGVLCGQHP